MSKYKCKECGHEFESEEAIPCPECGNKMLIGQMSGTAPFSIPKSTSIVLLRKIADVGYPDIGFDDRNTMVGFEWYGVFRNVPIVGKRFTIAGTEFQTDAVTEIIEDNYADNDGKFSTKHAAYYWKLLS